MKTIGSEKLVRALLLVLLALLFGACSSGGPVVDSVGTWDQSIWDRAVWQ